MRKYHNTYSIFLIVVMMTITIVGYAHTTMATPKQGSYVDISKDKVEIGNKAISRVINIEDSKLQTIKVLNKRINKELDPQKGSEDFSIHLVAKENKSVNASDLTIDKVNEVNYKTGKKVQFTFNDFKRDGNTWSIIYNVFVENNHPYIRSNITISMSKDDVAIDYIDAEQFVLPDNVEGLFHHPPLDEISSMWIRKRELVLGQPIYADGMFFGSEFPASDTDVSDEMMKIRYYSGKDFSKLGEDNQLNKDGSFTTWNSVMGAATGVEEDVVQTALFSYINDIATQTNFRKQYNSWYDNMLNITDDSITKSFYGTEKELAKNGVEPLDSYVVDDGWNAYETVNDNGDRTGSPYKNKTGFWEFNDKFPNELYPASDMAHKFNSTFGLWMGPQGGYNYFGGFAALMKKFGTGDVTTNYWNAIDVGSRLYLKNLTNLFVDYQKRFDIDYWKLDGFALRPSTNKNNHHMVGGDHDMYFTSDLWEGWIQTFDAMRAERAEEGKDLFLNLTSYVNPSPWLLQWANTVWLQDSGDIGFLDKFGGSQADQEISYRDNVYFNIFKKDDLQFPLKNVYNHDPIYGVSANVKYSDNDFRENLMMNATRGTAFWELYFSPSIMNEAKWKITADVLEWAESNEKILRHAKLFGKRPDQGGVYGYSSWNDGKGIISFRNAGNKKQTYKLTLNDVVGVPTNLKNAKMTQFFPYKNETNVKTKGYGDQLSVTLAPHEERIYQFTTDEESLPKLISIKSNDEHTIQVKFDQHIQQPTFTVNGKTIKGKVLADYRTVDIKVDNDLKAKNSLTIKVENIWGDTTTINTHFNHYQKGIAAQLVDKGDIENDDGLKHQHFDTPNLNLYHIDHKAYKFNHQRPLTGTNDFAISFKIRTTKANQTILSQKDAYDLSIDKKGYVNFTVGGSTINSKWTTTMVKEKAHGVFGTKDFVPTTTKQVIEGKIVDGNLHDITAVREANGMLKLYVDGELYSSKYVKDKVELHKNAITLGSVNTDIQIGDVKILNHAIGYDIAKQSYDKLKLEAGFKALDRTGYKAYADSEEKNAGSYEGPVENAIDGKKSTWWHTQYNGKLPVVPHWITIEMPEVKPVDAYKYVSRNGNGNVKEYELQISDTNKDGSWKTIKSGTMKNGGSTLIEFDKAVKAKFYRLYITKTYGAPGDTFASAAEIKLYTKRNGVADFSALTPLINKINKVNVADYTIESLKESGFNELKSKMKTIYLNPNSTQSNIDEAVSLFHQQYETILNQLVPKENGGDHHKVEIKMNGKTLKDKLEVLDTSTVAFTWKPSNNHDKVSVVFDEKSYESGTKIDLAGMVGKHELVVHVTGSDHYTANKTYVIDVITSIANMQDLVKRFDEKGLFKQDSTAHQLNLQLKAIQHYVKKDSAEKIVKHTKGFQKLLGHLEKTNAIPDDVYRILMNDATYVIKQQ